MTTLVLCTCVTVLAAVVFATVKPWRKPPTTGNPTAIASVTWLLGDTPVTFTIADGTDLVVDFSGPLPRAYSLKPELWGRPIIDFTLDPDGQPWPGASAQRSSTPEAS